MKIIDYFNQSPDELSLEKRIKKAGSLILMGSMLIPVGLGVLSQEVNAMPYVQKKQEQKIKKEDQKKKKKDNWFQRRIKAWADILGIETEYPNPETYMTKEKYEEMQKQKEQRRAERAKKLVIADKHTLNPPDFDVLNRRGKVHQEYRHVTFDQSKGKKNEIVVEIPEGGKIRLVEPQKTLDGYVADIIVYKNGLKLGGKAFYDKFDFERFKVKPGTQGDFSIQLEKGEHVPKKAGMRLRYRIVRAEPMPELPGPIDLGPAIDWPEPVFPEEEPKPVFAEEKEEKKKSNSRIYLGVGIEDINDVDTPTDPQFRFWSGEIDVHMSLDEKALVHFNTIYNNHSNIFNNLWKENIDIINLRAGGIYSVAPLALGAEVSYSNVSQSNTDIWSALSHPLIKYNNNDLLFLGKAGFASKFGKDAFALLALGGAHNQSQTLEDNVTWADFKILTQSDWNYVYGGEAFIDLGRDSDSRFALFIGGKLLFFRPIDKIAECSIKPELIDGTSYNLKVIGAVKLFKNFKLGVGGVFGKDVFNYVGDYREEQKRSGIKVFGLYNF
ncbi:hypothetical protein AYK26_01540 [Euryarchaeota archaeon SM23-78]|nr:MAG: hypothetical protein AYK26_01540 [Euryarchaeota archaeon SM23-78]MBW3000450.1 hypothetical protein [Candidatus Woesearchaeota archaeon]